MSKPIPSKVCFAQIIFAQFTVSTRTEYQWDCWKRMISWKFSESKKILSLKQKKEDQGFEPYLVVVPMLLSIGYILVGLAIGFLMGTVKDFILSKPPGRLLS